LTGGSGANSPAYISAPLDAIKEQAYQDGTSLFWDFTTDQPNIDASTDACLVFINAFATEGDDRPGLRGLSLKPPISTFPAHPLKIMQNLV
jgi:beta-glucosidase